MFTVYLLAVGGQAYASLSCSCVAMKAATEHVCCNHCAQHDDGIAATFDHSCCNDHHSTHIELYTASSDTNKQLRPVVSLLPPSLAVDCPCPEHIPFLREKSAERRAPFVREACVLPVGFRAPPVLA